jgi:hypothetical protein
MPQGQSAPGLTPPDRPFDEPPAGQGGTETAAVPYVPDDAGRSPLEDLRARHEPSLLAIEGVRGVGVGRTPAGEDALVLYIRDASVRQRVPKRVDGYPVETAITGEIDAYGPGSASGPASDLPT